jgi:hypothetical protein
MDDDSLGVQPEQCPGSQARHECGRGAANDRFSCQHVQLNTLQERYVRAPPPQPTDDYREDLIFLRDMFPRLDRSFVPDTVRTFRTRIEAALHRVITFTPAVFAMEVAHALAAADNAHTTAVLFHQMRVAPVRLHWFADGLHVIRAATELPELVGSRILTIDGLTPEAWLARLRDYIGGNAARRRALSVFFLSSAEALSSIEPTAPPDTLMLAFCDRRGREQSCVLDSAPLTTNAVIFPWRDPHIGLARGELPWQQVLDRVRELPTFLRDPTRTVIHEWLPRRSMLYVAIRRVSDGDDFSLESHLAGIVEETAARRICNVLVDLRFNDGGNFMLARKFCQALPSILPPDGRLFVATNNQTFSAGIVVAALLKFHGGARTLIVGESPGDRSKFWADGGVFGLPRTDLPVRCATGYHDWEHGCRDFERGGWFNLLYSVPAGSLEPTLAAPLTFADYERGTDPVMNAVCKWLDCKWLD